MHSSGASSKLRTGSGTSAGGQAPVPYANSVRPRSCRCRRRDGGRRGGVASSSSSPRLTAHAISSTRPTPPTTATTPMTTRRMSAAPAHVAHLLLVLQLAVGLLALALLRSHERRRLLGARTLAPVAIVRLFASAREAAGRGRDDVPGGDRGRGPWRRQRAVRRSLRRGPVDVPHLGQRRRRRAVDVGRAGGRGRRAATGVRRGDVTDIDQLRARRQGAAGARRRRLLRAPCRAGSGRSRPRRAGPPWLDGSSAPACQDELRDVLADRLLGRQRAAAPAR